MRFPSRPIDDLVSGKPALRNGTVGGLCREFGSSTKKGEELPLDELDAVLGAVPSPSPGDLDGGRGVWWVLPRCRRTILLGDLDFGTSMCGWSPSRCRAKRLCSEAKAKT